MAGDRDPIANTGLSERLEQHSRQNGFALGLAMAACILIALAGFIYLYTHITILPDFSNRINSTSIPSSRQPVSGTAAHDRAGAQALAQAGQVRLQRPVRRPGRVVPPHHIHQAPHRHRCPCRQGERREHRLALRRADIQGLAPVGLGADLTQQTNPHLSRPG